MVCSLETAFGSFFVDNRIQSGNRPRVLFAICTRNSITGTSVSTPATMHSSTHTVRYF